MLVSYRWLRELLPALDREPEEIAEALTAVGLAVDAVHDHTGRLRPVTIATVIEVRPHPVRPQLKLVTIRVRADRSAPMPSGSLPPPSVVRPETPAELTVVCGASNVPPPGHQVVFAGVGANLPGVGIELTPRDIGGVVSEGMLTSEAELGLAESSDGILTFPPDTFRTGTRFIDAFPEARDTVFELDVTPNRPDALGHVGVARDVAAFFELDFKLPAAGKVEESGASTAMDLAVVSEDPDRCPRYGAAIVRDVQIAPSPDAMRWRLHRLGIRPISNVVDVTNWLLLEFGQPLHAFDLTSLRGGRLVIRRATAAERAKTLDGATHDLVTDDLVIADAGGVVALAGIMGGHSSEISDSTTNVVLECAHFEPRGIRRTARRLGLHTESSHRFERGTDPAITDVVLRRARVMLAELARGAPAPGVVRADGAPFEPARIELRSRRLDALLGVPVPFREATRVLSRLGFGIEFVRDTTDGGEAVVRGASHRPDVKMEHDLVEEVARIRGLDAIPTELPVIPVQQSRTSGQLERATAQIAVELGLSEALTYSFVSPRELEVVRAAPSIVRLLNPLSEERSVLRTSLLPGLLEALRRARRRGERRVTLFSIGAVFLPVAAEVPHSEARPRADEDRGVLPIERPTFAALLAGPRPTHGVLRPEDYDVYDAKAVAIEMVERLTRRRAEVRHIGISPTTRHLHPRGAGAVLVDEVEVGVMGPLHPDVVRELDLDGAAQVVELDLSLLEALGTVIPRYRPIPRLPAVTRDLSLVVSDRTEAVRVAEAIRSAAGELCESVEPALEFRGGSVPEGHRSLTFRMVYRDPAARVGTGEARTLTDKEVDEVQARALERASREFGATLR